VPSLLAEAQMGSVPGVRARAQRLLHALGRATLRSQLSLGDRESRLQVIFVLGAIGSADLVPALADILRGADEKQREAAMKAIQKIGAPAVDPLVAMLGTKNDQPVLDALRSLGPGAHKAFLAAAARYGIMREPGQTPEQVIGRLALHLQEEQRARLAQEVERALELGREGGYTEAFERLNRVYAQDRDLYLSYAKQIAGVYLSRAERLVARGDYDAAVYTLHEGQGVHPLAEAGVLLMTAQLALARGYIELGDLKTAETVLNEADPEVKNAEARAVRAKLLSIQAEQALEAGKYGEARTLVERARSLRLDVQEIRSANRRLLFAENLAIVIVLALMIPAALLALVITVRRRAQAARLRRLALAIDTEPRGAGGAPVLNWSKYK
jgi:tetratricopeptide (TPR) repeat protein